MSLAQNASAGWSVVAAVNDDRVLQESLLRSPDLQRDIRLIVERKHPNAASAYNAGLSKAETDLVMFAHQDMYFPEGWFTRASAALAILEEKDPAWGVVGVWGATRSGGFAGHLYWTGLKGPRGQAFDRAVEVDTLDEVVLIFRKSSGLRFDHNLPFYHMYGPDICLEARKRGRKSYAISCFCVHNTNTYDLLPIEFWKCYWFIRKKWRAELPINTSCTRITRWCWPAVQWNFIHGAKLMLGMNEKFTRVADPSLVCAKFQACA